MDIHALVIICFVSLLIGLKLHEYAFGKFAVQRQARTIKADNEVSPVVGDYLNLGAFHESKFVQVLLHGIVAIHRADAASATNPQHK